MPLRGTRDTNTMAEALRGVMQDLAFIQTLPDADVEFIASLQQTILSKLRAPMEAYMQSQGMQPGGAGAPPMMDPAMMGAPMGPGPAAPPSPDMGGGGVPGLRNGGALPPVDELRRLLGAQAGA